jgi:hypothetical protein
MYITMAVPIDKYAEHIHTLWEKHCPWHCHWVDSINTLAHLQIATNDLGKTQAVMQRSE